MRIYIPIPSWKDKPSLDKLKAIAEVVVAEQRPSQEEFQAIIKDFDGVIIGRLHQINEELFNNSNLKFVSLIAKGTDNIDKQACQAHGVPVFYTPEANITSVAEHAMALILACAKNILTLDQSMRQGAFDKYRLTTFDIKGKTLGVIGAGPIAKALIKRAQAFEMRIICHTRSPEKHADLQVPFVSLETLLKEADFVSVNIPLTPETEHCISTKELELMKPTAYLINTSRGKVVDENALIQLLKDKKIAGAAIDVFEEEPTHNETLYDLENTILTPHVAGVSKEALDRMEEHAINDVFTFLKGKEPKYRLI